MAKLSDIRLGILRAMASRRAPLIRGHRHWFVRGWSVTVLAADVEALIAGGLVAPPDGAPLRGTPRLVVPTTEGFALAARAAARAIPPTHDEEIAA